MTPRIRARIIRAACPAAVAAALLAPAAAAPATAAAPAVVIGIGDQNPAFFSDPRFASLGLTEARYIVPWNTAITRDGRWRAQTRQWLAAAKAAGVTPLVSFTGTGYSSPKVSDYVRAVRTFLHDFPSVKRFTAWNEPDWIYRSLARQPQLAATYYDVLQSSCHSCLVVAGDVYLPAPQLGPWLKAYTRALHHHPQAWALHDYYDVRDHVTSQLRTLQRYTRGSIWLDETGGVEHRGHWQRESPAAAAANERYLFSLPQRFPRISRIYHYQWQVTTRDGWDSALVAFDGRVRPAYNLLRSLVRKQPYAIKKPPYAIAR